jgi:hypothetical protein
MDHKTGKVLMGATLTLAAIAIVVDHTQHQLPPIQKSGARQQLQLQQGTPCSLGDRSPCSLGSEEAPCSLGGGGRRNDL